MLHEILKLDNAHVLRERLTRDTMTFMSRILDIWKNSGDDNTLMLRIIKTLSKKSPRWLRNN